MVRAGIKVRTDRKWRTEDAIQEAETRLQDLKLVGVITRGPSWVRVFSNSLDKHPEGRNGHLVKWEQQ